MIRITKECDYGIMLLGSFASRPRGQVHTARQVAGWSSLPVPMVSKILRALVHGGLLESHRGVSGGYSMDRPAETTSVAEVIRALEGPISMVQCGAEPGACEHESTCSTRVNWARINRQVELALERVPIAEMVAPPCGGGAATAPLS